MIGRQLMTSVVAATVLAALSAAPEVSAAASVGPAAAAPACTTKYRGTGKVVVVRPQASNDGPVARPNGRWTLCALRLPGYLHGQPVELPPSPSPADVAQSSPAWCATPWDSLALSRIPRSGLRAGPSPYLAATAGSLGAGIPTALRRERGRWQAGPSSGLRVDGQALWARGARAGRIDKFALGLAAGSFGSWIAELAAGDHLFRVGFLPLGHRRKIENALRCVLGA